VTIPLFVLDIDTVIGVQYVERVDSAFTQGARERFLVCAIWAQKVSLVLTSRITCRCSKPSCVFSSSKQSKLDEHMATHEQGSSSSSSSSNDKSSREPTASTINQNSGLGSTCSTSATKTVVSIEDTNNDEDTNNVNDDDGVAVTSTHQQEKKKRKRTKFAACPRCGEQYWERNALKKHLQRVHNELTLDATAVDVYICEVA
jgi:hypothetical protein